MGQKVHPYGFRLGYNKNWLSRWFSKKDYPEFVFEDNKIRKFVKKSLYHAGISKIEIERESQTMRARLYYLRDRVGKRAVQVKEKRWVKVLGAVAATEAAVPAQS